jgi:hypothetical protein
MGIINLPKTSTDDKTQFIANVRTGAWGRYLGWDANCFCVFGNALYYGTSDGRAMLAETAGADDGLAYTATIFPSYSHLSSPGTRKQVKLVRPLVQANFTATPKITVRVDFDTTTPAVPSSSTAVGVGAVWDTAVWDVDLWPAASDAIELAWGWWLRDGDFACLSGDGLLGCNA